MEKGYKPLVMGMCFKVFSFKGKKMELENLRKKMHLLTTVTFKEIK